MNVGFAKRVLFVLALLAPAFLADARPVCACNRKGPAYLSAMRSDLKNLSTAQEAYYSDSGRYVGQLSELTAVGLYNTSQGVTIVITSSDTAGWSAGASHVASEQTCTISDRHNRHQDSVAKPQCTPNRAEERARADHRSRFAMFLASVAIALIGLALGRARPWAVATLILLCVVNPFWADPMDGFDCGLMVVQTSTAWVILGGLLAFASLTADRRVAAKPAART